MLHSIAGTGAQQSVEQQITMNGATTTMTVAMAMTDVTLANEVESLPLHRAVPDTVYYATQRNTHGGEKTRLFA